MKNRALLTLFLSTVFSPFNLRAANECKSKCTAACPKCEHHLQGTAAACNQQRPLERGRAQLRKSRPPSTYAQEGRAGADSAPFGIVLTNWMMRLRRTPR